MKMNAHLPKKKNLDSFLCWNFHQGKNILVNSQLYTALPNLTISTAPVVEWSQVDVHGDSNHLRWFYDSLEFLKEVHIEVDDENWTHRFFMSK